MTFPASPPGGADPDGFPAGAPADGLAAATLVEPDPAAGSPAAPDPRGRADRLPASLEDRFLLLEPLPRQGERTVDRAVEEGRSAELRAAVFRVRDRAARGVDTERVLKWYHPAAAPDDQVSGVLTAPLHEGLTRVLEQGVADGAPYELLPSHGRTDLATYLRDHGEPLAVTAAITLVRRLHGALIALHAAGVVHRDLKPSNLVVGDFARPAESAVLVDFGIAVAGPFPRRAPAGWAGTLRYASPQAVLHLTAVRPEDDWWALGMILAEVLLGRHPIRHHDPVTVGQAVQDAEFELDRITDRRLRELCEGLLTYHVQDRWGAAQVDAWLDETRPDPQVVRRARGPRPEPGPAGDPDAPEFWHEGRRFTEPARLGEAFDTHWQGMTDRLRRGRERARLSAWLAEFRPQGDIPRAEALDQLLEQLRHRPRPRTLVDLVTWLAPRQEPSYAEMPLGVSDLPDFAAQALQGDSRCLRVMADLRQYGLLVSLARRPDAGELAFVDERWRRHHDQWAAAAARLGAVPELAPRREEVREAVALQPDVTAELLQLAARPASFTRQLRSRLRQELAALPTPVPWFARLAGETEPVPLLLASHLHHLALEQAWERHRADEQARQLRAMDRDARHWRTVMRWLHLPVMLGRAAGGALLVFFPYASVVSLADVYGTAPQDTVLLAWLLAVPSLGGLLAIECWTAWHIGHLYHPRYSLMGLISRRALPLTRRITANRWGRYGLSLLSTATLVGAVWGAFTLAVWIWPLATVLGLLVVTYLRVRAWHRYLAEVRGRRPQATGNGTTGRTRATTATNNPGGVA
ncbi:serine/threonine-protein kinase [Streptomyces longwoodensis]|uniref:serine/threonine-protein kinase n=1 Tax=Streptomyces longwoodensis TaxID=68231 RepID=UPI0036FDF48E